MNWRPPRPMLDEQVGQSRRRRRPGCGTATGGTWARGTRVSIQTKSDEQGHAADQLGQHHGPVQPMEWPPWGMRP